jgi:hypothetical protein
LCFIRRVGVLAGYDDPEMEAFQQELARLGWSEGRHQRLLQQNLPQADIGKRWPTSLP